FVGQLQRAPIADQISDGEIVAGVGGQRHLQMGDRDLLVVQALANLRAQPRQKIVSIELGSVERRGKIEPTQERFASGINVVVDFQRWRCPVGCGSISSSHSSIPSPVRAETRNTLACGKRFSSSRRKAVCCSSSTESHLLMTRTSASSSCFSKM